jgi:NitT/TauT family transport system permease protein
VAERRKPASRLWGLVGIALLLAAWEAGHRAHGGLVLPGVAETAGVLWQMVGAGKVGPALSETAAHAILGWIAGAGLGALAGVASGRQDRLRLALQPVAVILLGVPAIAWGVLALLWFGGGWAVVFTVAVATGPLVFAPAVAAARGLDGDLARMARVFRAPLAARVLDVHGPQLFGALFPALATTLAMSWKVAVMAELLAGAGGIGDGLATARAQVDTAATMAWVLVVIGVLVAVDLLLLRPVQRRLWLWREDPEGARR